MVVIEFTREQFLDNIGAIEEWITQMYGPSQTEDKISVPDYTFIVNQGPGWKLVVRDNDSIWQDMEFFFLFDNEHDEIAFKLACL